MCYILGRAERGEPRSPSRRIYCRRSRTRAVIPNLRRGPREPQGKEITHLIIATRSVFERTVKRMELKNWENYTPKEVLDGCIKQSVLWEMRSGNNALCGQIARQRKVGKAGECATDGRDAAQRVGNRNRGEREKGLDQRNRKQAVLSDGRGSLERETPARRRARESAGVERGKKKMAVESKLRTNIHQHQRSVIGRSARPHQADHFNSAIGPISHPDLVSRIYLSPTPDSFANWVVL
ncbi:hypothetical protein DFH09DRAFT_1281664 [Mycena vulgaris]|nr:hypothetical protein DFH09DRAFT_1281664 [Mycena vulgaris]